MAEIGTVIALIVVANGLIDYLMSGSVLHAWACSMVANAVMMFGFLLAAVLLHG